jgi:hypothetical protein
LRCGFYSEVNFFTSFGLAVAGRTRCR